MHRDGIEAELRVVADGAGISPAGARSTLEHAKGGLGVRLAIDGDRKETDLKPLRIVVVDDMPDNRESMALLLEVKGHTVRLAGTGPEGLQVISEERPDVALIDIGLPGFDGYELARRLRRRPELAGALLIALTGYGNDSDKERAIEAGFDAYIVKPFAFEAFVDCVEKAPLRAH